MFFSCILIKKVIFQEKFLFILRNIIDRCEFLKAAVYYGRKNVKIEKDYPEPKPGKGEVKIAVKWCGICGTDLHEYLEGPIFIPTEPHPLTGRKLPVVLGHEFSGEIVEVGPGVKDWSVGDRVTADACIVCWECYFCKRMLYNLCEKLGFNGLATDGAFADYVVVPAYQLYRLPDTVSYEEGALVEPLSVGIHAIRKSGLQEGDTVFIAGAGPIGLCTLLAAKAAGAGKIYVSEILPRRIELAKKLGATEVLNPKEVDVKKEIADRTNGIGVDVAFEAVGYEPALRACLDVTRKGGTICVIGIFPGAVSIMPTPDIVVSEHKIVGSIAYAGEFTTAIDLMADGRIDVKPLITAKIGLEDLIEKGFKELVEHKEKHIKILVSPEI